MRTVNLIVAALGAAFFITCAFVPFPDIDPMVVYGKAYGGFTFAEKVPSSPETSRAMCKLYYDEVWKLLHFNAYPSTMWHIRFCRS